MNSAVAELSRVEVPDTTAGKMMIAHNHALSLVDHCYRAWHQSEGSEARRNNVRAAILDLQEVAARFGYELVPARHGRG